jgi:serine protease Do
VIGINSAIASRTGFYSGYGFAIPISLARSVMDDLVKHGRVRAPVLGVSINEVSPEDAKVAGLARIEGVLVSGFNPAEGSPAERAGLEAGDVIVAADGRPVDRVSTLQRIVRTHEPGETVTVDVMRFGQRRSFKVRLVERPEAPTVTRAANRLPGPAAPTAGRVDRIGLTVEAVSAEFARESALEPGDRGVRSPTCRARARRASSCRRERRDHRRPLPAAPQGALGGGAPAGGHGAAAPATRSACASTARPSPSGRASSTCGSGE